MERYRAYGLNGEKRIAGPGLNMTATSDEEAVAMAMPLLRDHLGAEVWCGVRLVASLSNAPMQAMAA